MNTYYENLQLDSLPEISSEHVTVILREKSEKILKKYGYSIDNLKLEFLSKTDCFVVRITPLNPQRLGGGANLFFDKDLNLVHKVLFQ